MERHKKIRGHKRRWKKIEAWRTNNMYLNFDWLNLRNLGYIKFKVDPWTITTTTSSIPQPYGKTRSLIVSGFLAIYDHWKEQLATFNEPYYLAIWLYEPRILESQVVCAIGTKIPYYNDLFDKPTILKPFQPANYAQISERLEHYKWEQYSDDEVYFDDEIDFPENYASHSDYEADNILVRQALRKPHRIKHVDGGEIIHLVRRGNLWIGT